MKTAATKEPPLFNHLAISPSSIFSVNSEGKRLHNCHECGGVGGWLLCTKEKKWTTKKGIEKSMMVSRKVKRRQLGTMLYHKYECKTEICPSCKGAGLEVEE